MGFDDLAVVLVVGDHAGDDEREVLRDVARQQVVEAVFLLGAEEHHAAGLGGVGDFPVHAELRGHRSEALGEFRGREVERLRPDLHAHEEASEFGLGMLAGLGDPALMSGHERGDPGHDAAGVRAGEAEGQGAGHAGGWKGRGAGVKTRRRRPRRGD